MPVTQLADVIVPAQFTDYVVQNTMEASALVQSGIVQRNNAIEDQLRAGADSFSVPFWNDLSDDEADIVSDDPNQLSTPRKITAQKQTVRKAYLHASWSAMSLASELAGSDALARIQARVTAYWTRQVQRRLIATLNGILADNVANDNGDMVLDIAAFTGSDAQFSAAAVIDCAGTMGDRLGEVTGVAVYSDTYRKMLRNDLVEFVPDSQGRPINTFRGMAVIVDDGMPKTGDVYTTVLFTPGAVGWGVVAPRIAPGTEIENRPSAGNGGGQQVLHSRVNLAVHPSGFAWDESSVADESPTIAELADPLNWTRVVERKAVGLAFLKHKV
jgi:hypothetical protein